MIFLTSVYAQIVLLVYSQCTGFLYIHIFVHLSYKLTASFLDCVFMSADLSVS